MIDQYVTIELEGRDAGKLTQDVAKLMRGSIGYSGCGMAMGGNSRDIDLTGDTQEELDNFIELLAFKGYKVTKL